MMNFFEFISYFLLPFSTFCNYISGLCKFICSMVMTDDGRWPSFLVRLCGWDRRVSSALASSCFYGIGLTLFGHRLDVRFVCLLFEWALHGAPWLIGSTGLLLWSYINDWPSERTNRLCILLVGLLIDLGVVGVLKIVFRRKRPEYNRDDLLYEATFIDKFSFPSGHSSRVAMLSVFGGGFNNFHQHVPLASLFLLFFPPILAVSRVIMGRHFALDALAGLLIGINEGFCVRNIANWMFLDRI